MRHARGHQVQPRQCFHFKLKLSCSPIEQPRDRSPVAELCLGTSTEIQRRHMQFIGRRGQKRSAHIMQVVQLQANQYAPAWRHSIGVGDAVVRALGVLGAYERRPLRPGLNGDCSAFAKVIPLSGLMSSLCMLKPLSRSLLKC